MTYTQQAAKHLREVHFGGNWTWVNLKDTLSDITWQQATTKLDSFNTIVALTYHINYFVAAILGFLRTGVMDAHDKYSFDHPPIHSQENWQQLQDKVWKDAEDLIALMEQLSDDKLNEIFVTEKYGNYFRNFHGLIEHTHYHLGQIVILKKLLQTKSDNPAGAGTTMSSRASADKSGE